MVAACPFPAPRGSQVLIASVVEHLAADGAVVHRLTYPGGPEGETPAGVRRHWARFGRAGDPWRLGRHKLRLDGGLLWELWRLLQREPIDVIHAHNYEAPVLAYVVRWWTGVPVVYHAHNALADELGWYVAPGWRRRLASRLGAWLDGSIPRRADAVIALTQELAEYLVARGVARERVRVLPPAGLPGLEVGRAAAPPAESGAFVVAYAGNLDGYQDLEVLFDAFAQLRGERRDALLEVITHEADWQERVGGRLREWVARGSARVVVAADFAAVQERLAAAAALVCPRVSWSGYPIKLLNYRAAGRPIVAARGSAKELRDGVTALVVDDGDAAGLARALCRLHDDPGLARRLGEAARDEADAWAERSGFASQLDEIYCKIESRRAAEGPGGVRVMARLLARLGERISAMAPNGGAR